MGFNIITREIEDELRDNPVIREHIGVVRQFEMDWIRSFDHADENTYVYQVEGTQGRGQLTVTHVTQGDGSEKVVAGTLRLDTGETFDLFPAEAKGEPVPQ